METKFNVFEVLQIAEKIEYDGAKFYLETAQLLDDPELRNIYYELADWKAKHVKMYARMRREFSEKTGEFGTFDPDNYVLSHPRVMAGLAVFTKKPVSVKGLTGRGGKEEILKDAIGRAKEATIFYQGLKGFARDPASEDALDKIIREESRHIHLLTEEFKQR